MGYLPQHSSRGEFHSNLLIPQNAIACSVDDTALISATYASLTSGRMFLVGVVLPANRQVTTISFVSGAAALVTGSNQWFSLYDKSRALIGVTNDDTSTAWAVNTTKTLTLASPYTPKATDFFYLGIVVVASTVPSLLAHATSSVAANLVTRGGGARSGLSTSGLTNPASAPNPAGAPAGQNTVLAWAS